MNYSIIQKSQLEGASRLDAEYYQPEYLEYTEKLNRFEFASLDSLTSKIDVGFVSSMTGHFQEEGIPLLRTQNVQEFFVDAEHDIVYIDEEFHKKLKKSQVLPGYLLLARSGSIGNVGIVPEGFPIANSADIILIKNKSDRTINEFLAAFLNSKYGRFQIERGSSGGLQGHINLFSLEKLLIPLVNRNFQEEIRKLILQGLSAIDESKNLYQQAENLLLEELGLEDFKPREDLSFVVNFSDLNSVHRADADYFQPKYEKIEAILSRFKQKRLEDLCSLISYGTVPTSPYVEEDGIPYLKGENIQNCFVDYSKLVYLDKESTKKLSQKFYLKEDDIVISQMGTVGNAAIITKQQEGWLFASFTIRVRLAEKAKSFLDPLFVTLFIQNISRPYYLLRRIAQASVRQNTDLPTIRDLRIPILPKKTQLKIAELVRKSHEARKKSKQLLEEAKRKVEEIIEKGAKNG